jgi:hypothetical protein
MLEQWQGSQHRMRTVRRRIYAAHLTVCGGIIEQLEQVEIDALPTAFVTEWYTAYGAGSETLGQNALLDLTDYRV